MSLQRRTFLTASAAGAASLATGCATAPPGWSTLVDGPRMSTWEGFTPLGAGNWSVFDGTLQGSRGNAGFLLTTRDYADFQLQAEFWADEDCNSGFFLRCQDRARVTAENSYEVNIFDKRPDPTYATASIVGFAPVAAPHPRAANRWNTFDITAQGERITVVFNGQQTVDFRQARFKTGPIALQSAGGTVRFRRVIVRSL
jgi:hypothetical protein